MPSGSGTSICSSATWTRSSTARTSTPRGAATTPSRSSCKSRTTGFRDRVMQTLAGLRVEFRRGTSGGGNQLRQPYLRSASATTSTASIPARSTFTSTAFTWGTTPTWKRRKSSGSARFSTNCELGNSRVGRVKRVPPMPLGTGDEFKTHFGGTRFTRPTLLFLPVVNLRHATSPSGPGPGQSRQPPPDLSVSRRDAECRGTAGVGRPDGNLRPQQGLWRGDHRCRGGRPQRRTNRPALPRSRSRAGRRGGLRASAFGLDAGHAGRRRGMRCTKGTRSLPEGAARRRARGRAARADAAGRIGRFRGRRRRARRP